MPTSKQQLGYCLVCRRNWEQHTKDEMQECVRFGKAHRYGLGRLREDETPKRYCKCGVQISEAAYQMDGTCGGMGC